MRYAIHLECFRRSFLHEMNTIFLTCNASVTYDAAVVRFCGLRFVDAIFTNRTTLRAAAGVFTNVTATVRYLHKS